MRFTTFLLISLIVIPTLAVAQFTVSSTSPSNGAAGVSLNTTISITFSSPADTTKQFSPGGSFLTNIGNISAAHWSADRTTYIFDATLDSNSQYFVLLFGGFSAVGGTLTTAYDFHFTTAASFPGNLYTVSGSLSAGSTGVPPANAIVGLSANGLGTDKGPDLIAGSVTDGSGNFVIPYVASGSWTPVAAKDVNNDGNIDPSAGDVLALGSLVDVTSASVSGLDLVLQSYPPLSYVAGRDSALSFAALYLPVDRQLLGVEGESVDSTGHAQRWDYFFSTSGGQNISRVRVEPFRSGVDSNTSNWNSIGIARPIANLAGAAPADSFLAHVELQGGKAFRLANPSPDTLEFWSEIRLGDLRNTQFGFMLPDQSQNYWGAQYTFNRVFNQDSSFQIMSKYFVGEYSTGNLLAVTAVKDPDRFPTSISLDQNYPNPFNPTTTIRFGLPQRADVTLEVFNLLGEKVAVLARGNQEAGSHEVRFNAQDLSTGVYFYRLQVRQSDGGHSSNSVQTRKLLIVR